MFKILIILISGAFLFADGIVIPIESNIEGTTFYCKQEKVLASFGDSKIKVVWSNPYNNDKIEALKCKDYNTWKSYYPKEG